MKSDGKEKDLDTELIPKRSSSKWSDYVLGQFETDELWEGNPKTEGMRRVAELIIGPIISSEPEVIQAPNWQSNNNTATVKWTIKFLANDPVYKGMVLTFADVADTNGDNTNGVYALFPSPTSATKAEGRALRKALGLKNVFSMEEKLDQPDLQNTMIVDGQIVGIDRICERNDINVMNFVNMGATKYKKIEDVPFSVAQVMFRTANEYQGGKRTLPDSVKGYKKNWRGK